MPAAAIVTTDAGWVRAIDRRRRHAVGDEGRRRAGRLPGRHQRPRAGGWANAGGRPRASPRCRALAAADGRRRACRRPGRRVRARRRQRRHTSARSRPPTVRSGGRSTTRASCGRRHVSTCPRRSYWRSGTRPAPTARALDLATGAVRWEQPVGLYTAGPGLDRGRAFLATGDGRYHAWIAEFDVAAGASEWALRVPASFQSGMVPAVDARDLVLIDQLGRVIDIDPMTGTPRWTPGPQPPGVRLRGRAPARDAIVVTTLSGELFVLDRVSGRVVARADTQRLRRPSRCWRLRSVAAIRFWSRCRVVDPGASSCAGCRDD